MKTPTLLLAAVLLTSKAGPDEVFLKGGGQLSGKIVSRTATTRRTSPWTRRASRCPAETPSRPSGSVETHGRRLRPVEPETVTYAPVTTGEARDSPF
jgi:hypothetical protein